MKIEIAICTWNRAQLLRQTLERLATVIPRASDDVGLIVVDNDSNDDTAAVIDSYSNRLPISYLQETEQGHCFARNAAIDVASGDYLIWIDDDVLVGNTWLADYSAAFSSDSQFAFWGGPIVPQFVAGKPAWIDQQWEKLKGCYAARDLGNSSIELNAERLPYGANFAIRTEVQKAHRFDTSFGRRGDAVVGDDEVVVLHRVLEAGHRGCWVPQAGVQHLIEPSRATEDYVRRYFVGQGWSLVLRQQDWGMSVEELQKEMKHELLCYRLKRYFTGSEVWLSHLIRGSLAQGQLEAKQLK